MFIRLLTVPDYSDALILAATPFLAPKLKCSFGSGV